MQALWPFLIFSVGFNLILFLVAYFFQTDKLTDISFSITIMCIAINSFTQSEQSIADIFLLGLVIMWGIRLGSYLAYRIQKMGSDKRFEDIRTNFLSFFSFWLMQGLTCFIVMIPVLLCNNAQNKIAGVLFFIGVALAFAGWIIESIADYQKFKFKRKHPEKFMNNGLWSILQHPNYAGELLFWWAIFLACIPFSNVYLGLLSPLWITIVIVGFSGVRILQKKWKDEYGDDPKFQKYHQTTKKLIPFIY